LGGEGGWVECPDAVDAAMALEEPLPKFIHLVPERGDHSQAGDYDASIGPI
jgi:hypothetical protein